MPIINGVDVKGCEYFNGFCEKYDTDCAEKDNCIYKQLQRVKAENEQLKNNLDVAYLAMEQTEKEIGCIKKTNRDLLATVNDYKEDIKELKEILQEIEKLLLQIDENNWFHTGGHIYMNDKCIDEIKTRILTLIKKAEEE